MLLPDYLAQAVPPGLEGLKPFVKMHGLRNHFVIFDQRLHPRALPVADIVRLCDVEAGVGAEQVLTIEAPTSAGAAGGSYARMRIFNIDGREAGACGNATRCVAHILLEESGRDELVLETGGGLLACRRAGPMAVAVTLGPQDDRFTAAGIAALLEGPYELLPQSDRMGARLKGPFIEHTRGHDIVSDGVPMGGIQVIGEGQPIVLLADRQSAGGYTKIATVCSFDLGRIAQLKPGGRLAFRRVTVAEAHAMLRDSVRALDTAIE